MTELITYLVESSLSITVLVVAYKLLFSNQASFKSNRVILLTIVLFGFAGSVLSALLFQYITVTQPGIPVTGIPERIVKIGMDEIIISSNSFRSSILNLAFTMVLVIAIYYTGVIIMSVRFAISVIKIIRIYLNSEKIKTGSYTIVLPDKEIATFSFFNLLFINKQLYLNHDDSRAIIKHEEIHMKQHHSVDVILAELLIIIQWFNPFVYLLKNLITENHEYLADRGTIAATRNLSDYKILVLSHSIQHATSRLANNFSYLLIKKRIKMMEKRKSKIKTAFSLAVFAVIISLVSFSCSDKDNTVSNENKQTPEPAQVTQPAQPENTPVPEATSTIPERYDTVYAVVEKMPEFPGGRKVLMNYLKENIKYPEQAKKKGITGRVFINFIVEPDGSVTHVNVLRGIGHGCDEEAIRVVKNMPKWIPGEQQGEKVRVSFNLPIKFVLD